MKTLNIVSKNWGKPNSWTLAAAKEAGTYAQARRVLSTFTQQQVIDEVTKSNLRGRGGAGFPTGMKWTFVSKEKAFPKYLVINGDEGEPGTVKDRYILSEDPHGFIEGCIIGSFALSVEAVYVYCRGEFYHQMSRLQLAIEEAYKEGILGDNVLGSGRKLHMYVHPGAGAYICGEETALLESLEGKKGWPRLKPPFPANAGLFGKPTAVNNVETLAAIPGIIEMGGEKWATLGAPKNGGTRLIAVSGHVVKPGTYEVPMSANLKEIIFDLCGGIPNGRKLKAVVPGGSSAAIMTPEEIDCMIDFDTLKAKKTMAGSGGIMVIDDSVNMAFALHNIVRFYAHESCGQCTPCREGTGWTYRLLQKIVSGHGEMRDIDLIDQIAKQGETRTICALFDGCAMPVRSVIQKWRGDFEALVKKPHEVPVGKPLRIAAH